ncbi:MAG: hypothetical protein H0T49_02875 [Chloroflexia bacterium]|nr:hypothetical protein [Chloroflexia bacterium]
MTARRSGTAAAPPINTRPEPQVGELAVPTVAPNADPAPAEVAGSETADENRATRGGEDTRRRGWFWHWNSIVTQYAPLLGLKGVGLLNSYTVWTDRREESPHRGYAFPSQQREADFYGEDRAELIAINKILVALDLIEIRKEMVLRTDERGRRWRVPHNFYRVKDHADGFALTARDVMRVVELAGHDKAIYRYIRRLFSPHFAPIDPENVWHQMLPELRATASWARLAAQAERDEDRASARTRAGHASRRAGASAGASLDPAGAPDPAPQRVTPPGGADQASKRVVNDSGAGVNQEGEQTSVAPVNNGLEPDVEPTNTGLTAKSATAVDRGNEGEPTSVDPVNTTYYQSGNTTTTTTGGHQNERNPGPANRAGADHPELFGGPGGPPPDSARDEAAAFNAFEAANARRATPAERQLLRGLAERFDLAARTGGNPTATGWAWIAAAAYEAVEAGSAFVAPRRLREILRRWERDGFPGTDESRSGGADPPARTARAAVVDPVALLAPGPDPPLDLPHGFDSRQTWAFTVGLLGTALDPTHLAALVRGSAISGYHDGEVTIAVPGAVQAEAMATSYRELISRKLSEALRRPVRLAVLVSDPGDDAVDQTVAPQGGSARDPEFAKPSAPEPDPVPVSFIVTECGLPSGQVWSAVLEEVVARGEISRANIDTWLRGTRLLDRTETGGLVIGAPQALAQRRIASRFLAPLRAAVAATIGATAELEIVVTRDWLLRSTRRGGT